MESESLSKRLASDLLSRARQETGVHKPEDNPELMRSFQLFPDQLDKIEEQLHDLNAQAEISAGTDAQVNGQTVGGGAGGVVYIECL